MPQADSTSHDSTTSASTSPKGHDDLIIVPKGRSKTQFFLTLGLLIFVLLIFTVGGSFQTSMGGLFGGEETNPVYVAWTDPLTQQRHEVHYDEFQRRFTGLDTLHGMGAFQPRHAPEGKRRPRVSPEDVGLMLVLDQLAEGAGIEVGQRELTEFLKNAFQTTENMQLLARQRRMTVPALQDLLQKQLRVSKLMGFLAMGASAGAPAEDVQELWFEQHPQFQFQYTEVEGEQFLAQAESSIPNDEDLLAWFHEQPLFKQQQHFSEETYEGLVAYAPLDGEFDSTTLLERFPAPEGLDPQVQARSYYNRFNNVRFKNEIPAEDPNVEDAESAPEPESADAGTEEPIEEDGFPGPFVQDAADEVADEGVGEGAEASSGEDTQESSEVANTPAVETVEGAAASADDGAGKESGSDESDEIPLYQPFEDVKEQCLREAPVHAALTAWYGDLRTRMNAATEDAPIDFATEAESVGLLVVRIEDALTKDELAHQEGWGGKFLSNQFTYALEGDLLSSVVLEESAIVAGQLTKKIARQEPPLDEMREAVAADWAADRSVAIALEKLEAVRDALGERPADHNTIPEDSESPDEPVVGGDEDDEPKPWSPSAEIDAFKQAVESAGFAFTEREWLERYEVPGQDFDVMSAADESIRTSLDWFDLEAGQVPAPVANAAGTTAVLVRFSGQRDKPLDEITAVDLLRLRQQVSSSAQTSLGESLFRFDSDWFKQRFAVEFEPWKQDAREAAEEAAAAAAQGASEASSAVDDGSAE